MTGKRVFLSLAMTAGMVFSISGAVKNKVVESMWAPLPVVIDGSVQEWADSTPVIDEASKAEYALRNDGQNLYIILVFKTPISASTVDFTGIKIYFGAEGKKSKNFGILFLKKQITADGLIASLEKKGEALTEERKAEIRKQPTYPIFSETVISPKTAVAPTDPAIKTDPPIFRAASQRRIAIYEFKIPLQRVNHLGAVGADPGQSVMLGFEWGGMTAQIMKDMMAGRADRSVSAGDRGVSSDSGFSDSSGDLGGDIRGMGSGVSELRRDARYKKYSFWIEAKLATKD
jgi:hypothetical protein